MDNDGGGEVSSSSKPSDCRTSSPFLSLSNGVCSSLLSVTCNKNAAICKGMSDLSYNSIFEPEQSSEVVENCDSTNTSNGRLCNTPVLSVLTVACPTSNANDSLSGGGDLGMSSPDSDCQSRCSRVPDSLDCGADFLDSVSSDSHSSKVCRANNEDHHVEMPHQESAVKMRHAVPERMLTSRGTFLTNNLQNFTEPHYGITTIVPCEDSHSSLSASNSYTERTQCNVNSVTPTVYNNCNPVDSDSNTSLVTDRPSELDNFSRLGYDSLLNTDSVNNSIETQNSSNSSSMNNSNKVITSSYPGSVNTNECDNFMNDRSSQGNVTVCGKSFESNLYQCNNSNEKCMKSIVDQDLPDAHMHHAINGTLENDLSYESSDPLSDQRESEPFKPELPQDAAGEARFKQRRKSRKPLKSSVRYVQNFPSHNQCSSPPPSVHSLAAATQLSPPPTLASPPPPPLPPSTPPVTVQPPLSPPLSDIQSSLSSLSPCSSINSDESKCASARAPLPRLLPIGSAAATAACAIGANSSSSIDESPNTNNSASSNVLPSAEAEYKRVKLDGFAAKCSSNSETLPSSSSPCGVADILPPPPPYPKKNDVNLDDMEKSFQNSNKGESPASNDEDSIGEGQRLHQEKSTDAHCNGELKPPLEKRPPPPPYHSHFFVKKTITDAALDSSVNVCKKGSSDEDNLPASSRSDSPGSFPPLGESFWSSVHLPSTLSVSPVPSELEKQRGWTDHGADRSNNTLTDCKSSSKVNRTSIPNHQESNQKQNKVKSSSCGAFNRSFDSSDGSEAGSTAAKNCSNSSKLSGTTNGSNLSYYSTATVAMLLQQLAAAQRQGASGNGNGDAFESEQKDASDSREEHPESSRLREEQYLKQLSKKDRHSTGTSRNHQVEDGDRHHGQSQKGDKKASSNTININIDKSNLSSILNNLIARTSIAPDSMSVSSSNDRFSDPRPSHLALESLLPASSSVSISTAVLTPSSSANSGSQSPTSSSVPTSSSSTSSFFQSSSDLLSQLSRQSLLPATSSSGSLKLPSLSSSAQQLALKSLTSASPILSPNLSEPNNENRLQTSTTPCLDLSSKQLHCGSSSPQSVAESQQHQQQSHVTAALLAAAALQNSYGGGMPSMMMDSPLSRLLMGNSTSSDCSSYAALTGSTDFGYPGLSVGGSSGYGGVGLSPTEAAAAKADANSEHSDATSYQKLLQESGMNSLNNIATLSYLLQQQQQMESLGLGGGGTGNNATSLNGLAALSTLNSLAGLSSLPPGLMSDGSLPMPLHQVLKKMRYADGSGGASTTTKRKPRSSNHTKSFHCSLCSKRFSLKDELEEHMLTHTSDELGNESYMQKSFACTECSFRTKYKFCLQRHMHIHSGEKPLVCPYCRYRSISKVSYDNHIRTHTGEKPFACPYCSYKSSFKNNLTKHIKTHTGSSKPYTCNKCSSCFTSQMQLKSHMRLHLDPTGTHNCTQCLYTCMSRFELECHMRTHIPV